MMLLPDNLLAKNYGESIQKVNSMVFKCNKTNKILFPVVAASANGKTPAKTFLLKFHEDFKTTAATYAI
jgi:hypothetical protein